MSIDLNRNITSWNKGAENLYGFAAEEVLGKSLELVLLPEDIKALIEKVNDIVNEVTVPIYKTIRIHKNGRHTDLEILLSPVRNANGVVIGVSTVARDITVRKMHEQQKDDFIAIASHELKTPVTSIKAYAEILHEQLEQSGDEASMEIAKKLRIQVNMLIVLIKTLLDTTKLGAGEMLLEVEQFDLNLLVKEQIESLVAVSDNHNLILKAGEIKPISADRKLIGQVLTNIITNAIRYSPGGGDIIIATKMSENGVQVSIQDFGVGIPASEQGNIFDRYFRVSNPLTSRASGIGLGLYITAGIVHQHGGTISLVSEEGKGSIFLITLPEGGKQKE